ncbi:MAG: aminopeptidase N [Burkholderiaceae bacterium]|jgi:aminopeptidase N|nr:aminopeptidase N [Burkholderiaceae bacterium]
MTTTRRIYRKNYTPPPFFLNHVELAFDLDPDNTRVHTVLALVRNPVSRTKGIVLYGDDLTLLSLKLDGRLLKKGEYSLKKGVLRIPHTADTARIETETRVCPKRNTALSGLYLSSGNLLTQCEAEGFRKISFFPDRPDVMATYTVTLTANKEEYPVLLSNGNLVEQGPLPGKRHYARWEDPFRKPSYLFAIVAGRLVCHEERFTLASGRQVLLQIWVEESNLDKTAHAMSSLQHSIRWDEARYGLELDLDRFMIVAVSDFNMGAMENKGLNIFNARYILANPTVATDADYAGIESVVGHEYFHNWTGNRVTCRDWFQLSLKEGLTVFRDQEFSADRMGSKTGAAVKRIEDVRQLRQQQFPEDAGAMAHPIRPDSYEEINNFYTATVYEKGAEVVRMYQTLLGEAGFGKGMALYFQRHDGQAVTCKDFMTAMADANQRHLSRFERWYSQAGTPRVRLTSRYRPHTKTLSLTLSQSTPPTPGQTRKYPLVIPVSVGLLDSRGRSIPCRCATPGARMMDPDVQTILLDLTKKSQTFTFTHVPEKPVVSALRHFSAPVILEQEQSVDDLVHLFSFDPDAFNRWEAGQRLAMYYLLRMEACPTAMIRPAPAVIQAFCAVLRDASLDPAFRALAFTLPTENMLAEAVDVIDPQTVCQVRQCFRATLSGALQAEWLSAYTENHVPGDYRFTPKDAGQRSLRNTALSYLLELDNPDFARLALRQYEQASNMTDRMAALSGLLYANTPASRDYAEHCLQHFYHTYQTESLLVDKWFSLQASSPLTSVDAVRKLTQHPAFTLKNPNRARSLIFAFCLNNMSQFHGRDSSGYAFWADYVLQLDRLNPQIAARLSRAMTNCHRYIPQLKSLARDALKQVATRKLSRDTREVIEKIRAV